MAKNTVHHRAPDIIPPQQRGRLVEYLLRLRSKLATPIKIPAWLVIVFGIYRGIPDLFGETQWWIDAARDAGGAIGPAAMLIASPYFGPALVVVGILWLIFAGEPQRGVLRAHWWLYVGWAGAGLLFVAVLMTMTFGYALSTFGPRHLSNSQREALSQNLSLPPGLSQEFAIQFEMGCSDCQGYANELAREILKGRGWVFGGIFNGTMLSGPLAPVQPGGIVIDVTDPKKQAVPIRVIETAFKAARIPYTLRTFPPAPPAGDFAIEVRPREDQ